MKIEAGKSLWFPDCIARTLVEYHVTEVSENTVKAETDNENVEKEIEIHLPENPKSGYMKAASWGYILFTGKLGAQHFLDTHNPFEDYTKEGKETIVSLLMNDNYLVQQLNIPKALAKNHKMWFNSKSEERKCDL